MQCLVGLGNPGERYRDTRHNLGFRVVDLLAARHGGSWQDAPTYRLSQIQADASSLLLIKPTTFMNDSGRAVSELMAQSHAELSEVLVVLDDIHLEPGTLRVRRQGSGGGHNGLQSIIDGVGESGFPRLRLGIGSPPEDQDQIDYVLGTFPKEDEENVDLLVERAADAVLCWANCGTEETMNRYNAA